MFEVPPNTLPYVMYIMIICHWAILHYNMIFKPIAGRCDCVFWWFHALSEDQEFFLSNSPKLSCGFNIHDINGLDIYKCIYATALLPACISTANCWTILSFVSIFHRSWLRGSECWSSCVTTTSCAPVVCWRPTSDVPWTTPPSDFNRLKWRSLLKRKFVFWNVKFYVLMLKSSCCRLRPDWHYCCRLCTVLNAILVFNQQYIESLTVLWI